MIKRDYYLNKLIKAKQDGYPKVITGIRRCGKSYLLKTIYHDYLISQGVKEEQIIALDLDDYHNTEYLNPFKLAAYIEDKVKDKSTFYYVFIDEIQMVMKVVNPVLTNGEIVLAKDGDENVVSFVEVVLGISRLKNVDLYVTGSNSKMLSKDVVTQFRDKATNIHLYPLSFKEYYEYVGGDKYTAFNQYRRYGGMPATVLKETKGEKEEYLKSLFNTTYLRDIIEHNHFRKSEALDEICDIISFYDGTLLNTQRIANIFESRKHEKICKESVEAYLDAFEDAYLISQAERYDVKGGNSIGATRKYYFTDLGLRNARVGFSSLDMGQLLENIVYNELIIRGYNVKVGSFNQVEKDKNGKSVMKTYEIDFLASKGLDYVYYQVTDNVDYHSTQERETAPFKFIRDSYRKVVLVNTPMSPMGLENGVVAIGVVDFLLNL